MAHRLNTNKQFMVGNGILAFAVIFVVVIFVYMSMRLQQQKAENRNFIATEKLSLFELSEKGGEYRFEKEGEEVKQLAQE